MSSQSHHDLCLPLRIGVAIPVALVLLIASPVGTNFAFVILGIPILLFCWLGLGIWSAVLSAIQFRCRQWLLSGELATLPIVVTIVALNLLPFMQKCNYVGGVIHFVVARPYYEYELAKLPRINQKRLAVFNWGGMVWASRGIVYDESDEVALPPGRQSQAWLHNPGLAELSCEGCGITPLWSHYYLASFPC